MADGTEMRMEWLRYLQQRTEARENEITKNVLQVPDYPPLPECWTCGVVPEQITTHGSHPSPGLGGEEFVIDFSPCGHRFTVPASELLRG